MGKTFISTLTIGQLFSELVSNYSKYLWVTILSTSGQATSTAWDKWSRSQSGSLHLLFLRPLAALTPLAGLIQSTPFFNCSIKPSTQPRAVLSSPSLQDTIRVSLDLASDWRDAVKQDLAGSPVYSSCAHRQVKLRQLAILTSEQEHAHCSRADIFYIYSREEC